MKDADLKFLNSVIVFLITVCIVLVVTIGMVDNKMMEAILSFALMVATVLITRLSYIIDKKDT